MLAIRSWIVGLALMAVSSGAPAWAASDLYIRDTLTDGGSEPYTGPGPLYLSPDIWVRNEPDPNFDPRPFSMASPPWTPQVHQNPEYRNPKTSGPNYVYVRIHNRGDQQSLGTERLRLYEAKASTGLTWPANWVDNEAMICGADQVVGIEITKPRRNAKSVSGAERDAYRDALVKIASDPAYRYSDMVQYFRKQNAVHQMPNPEHGNPAFLPWHREMMNRYEQLLREADPLVTLLYWDFTEDPRTGTNLFTAGTTGFMGASSGTVGAPLTALQPPTLSRNVGGTATQSGIVVCSGTLFTSDATFNAMGNYSTVSRAIEGAPNHDCAHGYIGGYTASAGQISSLATAAQDPFFFMLHANVDRQWANWQRQNANPDRLDPVSVYGTDSSNARIDATMNPWNGSGTPPWNGAGAATNKTSKDRSIVFPPIYDTAPLNIPRLQPGQSVVIEIPWYPPNANNFNCSGDAGHFCLLARIETSVTSPFGMTSLEGANVETNTRNNNNIAWKNVTIVDNIVDPSPLMLVTGTTIRNMFDRRAIFEISLNDRTEKNRFLLPEFAQVALGLPEEILKRLRAEDSRMTDLRFFEDKKNKRLLLEVVGKEPRFTLTMKPGESFTAEFVVRLRDDKIPRALLQEPFHYDIEQRIDLPRDYPDGRKAEREAGGVRNTFDFAQILKNRDREKQVKITDLKLNLLIKGSDPAREGAEPATGPHLSVGEPLIIDVRRVGDPGAALRLLSLEVDGAEVATAKRANLLQHTLQFDKPGVHSIVTRGIDENGEVTEQRSRILVSENIPPNVLILSPEQGVTFKLGQAVEVEVRASAAFQRKVETVSLYVKDDDTFVSGLNLVLSPNYKPVAAAKGPGPHKLRFTPKRPGHLMLQVGAVDDLGITGVSGHTMIMVTE